MADSIEDLQTAVDNVHDALIQCNRQIISHLAESDSYEQTAIQWVEYANQLKRLVPDYAASMWLTAACTEFGSQYNSHQGHYAKIALFVTAKAPEIYEPILVGEAASLNVEHLFSVQSQRLELNDVFERLVARLAELIAADVIDNRTVHESLTRLHALFRRTKNGSFATVLMTMNFGRFFLKSFGGLLHANKYAKPIVENFEKEFAEASEIVQKAEEATKQEMIAQLTNAARIELFIESNPNMESTIAGFLPPPENAEDDG